MKQIAWFILAAVALLALTAPALAQSQPFPTTMPPQTVYGRLGTVPGPGQAIPFATLEQILGGSSGASLLPLNNTWTGTNNFSQPVGEQIQVGGTSSPKISFYPVAGATKSAQIYQSGDFLRFATAGVGDRVDLDLNTGILTTGGVVLSGITGSTQCLHVDPTGLISGTSADCGSSSGGLTPIANNRVLGNVSGANAVPTALTPTQLTTLCNPFTTGLSGCAPASGGGTTNFLRADGTWAAPPGGTGAVTSITNSDLTLTMNPPAGTGAVIASLNVGHANTWTALQTFNAGTSNSALTLSSVLAPTGQFICLHANQNGLVSGTGSDCGSSTGGGITSVANLDGTLTFSTTAGAVTGSLNLGNPNTWTAKQTFNAGAAASALTLSGVTGSTQCLQASSTGVVSGTGSACSGSSAVYTPVIPDSFCTVDRTGATDMGGCINSAIAASAVCSAAGNATLKLRAGIYLITTPIVPKSCINIIGDGRGKTILLTNANTPVAQPALTQLVHFNLAGVTFKDSGAHPGATVLTFREGFQANTILNIGFHGYTSGTAMSLTANGTVTAFSDTSGIFNSSNIFFNIFEDWIEDDQMATGLIIGGASTTPCNVGSVTNVVTLNQFKDIQFWGITGVGWNIQRFSDSNDFIGANSIYLNGTGAAVGNPHGSFRNIAVQLGDDNATCAGNNDVLLERIQVTTAIKSPATSIIAFNAGNNTSNNAITYNSDIPTSQVTGFALQPGVTQFYYNIKGRNYSTGYDDGAGNNFSIDFDQGVYRRWMDGTAAKPAVGWASDGLTGFYHVSTGITGLTGGLTTGVNGGSSGSVQFNGGTSGSFTIAASATGTPVTTAPWPFSTGGTGDNGSGAGSFTAGLSCSGATFTVNSTRFKQVLAKFTYIALDFTITTLGTCTTGLNMTLPTIPGANAVLMGMEEQNTNDFAGVRIASSSTTALVIKARGQNWATGDHVVLSGVYENQ